MVSLQRKLLLWLLLPQLILWLAGGMVAFGFGVMWLLYALNGRGGRALRGLSGAPT